MVGLELSDYGVLRLVILMLMLTLMLILMMMMKTCFWPLVMTKMRMMVVLVSGGSMKRC